MLASLAVKLGKACSCSTKGPKEKSPESKLITPSHVSLLGVSVPRGLVFLVVTTLEGLGACGLCFAPAAARGSAATPETSRSCAQGTC